MATITVSTVTSPLPRDELARFLPSARAVRSFEGMQVDVTKTIPDAMEQIVGLTNALLAAPYVTWAETPTLEQGRALAVTSALRLTNDGARLILGLAETGFPAGFYGSATQTIGVQTDLYGRVIGGVVYDLVSDNVAEGEANLYYTDERARGAISGGAAIDYNQSTGQIALADTTVTPGTYGTATDVPILDIDQKGRVTAAATATIPALASGTYTPTLTNIANMTSSLAYECHYLQVGSIVHVGGRVDVTTTAVDALTQLGISLPIPSDFTVAADAGGTAATSTNVAERAAAIAADPTNNRAVMQWRAGAASAQTRYFTFTYRVR